MTHFTLLMIETSGIQDFVFSSNSLRIITGASYLVKSATREWLQTLLQPFNPNLDEDGEAADADLLQEPGRGVEIIYRGGGNALLLFRRPEDAETFTRTYTCKLLTDAPGLRVATDSLRLEWEQDVLTEKFENLRGKLALRKQAYNVPRPLMGLGVSAQCVFTGEPASNWGDFAGGERKMISHAVGCRLENQGPAENELGEMLPSGWLAIKDFEVFGTHGESSYLAIVHADGNRIGKRIEKLADGCGTPDKNREYANLLRSFSRSSHRAAETALKHTLNQLVTCAQDGHDNQGNPVKFWQRKRDALGDDIPFGQREHLPRAEYKKHEKSDKFHLPFRPVLFGGDDVTFITDGRLGLALAVEYLQKYGEHILADGQKAIGRTGVAIVPSHYPFAQGYDLAESLAASAKSASENGKYATVDWHFGINGIVRALDEMRKEDYTVQAGQLCQRPYRSDGPLDPPSWHSFENLVSAFQTSEDWRDKRNKVKALYSAIRDGPAEVRNFLANYGLSDLPGSFSGSVKTSGWWGDCTPYFDPLEALDFHIPLEV